MQKRLLKNQQGVILPILLILMVSFAIIGLALTSYVTTQYTQTRTNVFTANAIQVAEAGIEQTLDQINQNETFSGYPTEQVFFNNATQGRAVFTTTISPTPDSNAKIVSSTAKVYRQNNPTTPVSTRKVKVTIVGTKSEGHSVYAGAGGLLLDGGASILNSDIYVNGRVTMKGGARIGTAAQPITLNVANAVCPNTASPGPTYPQVCPVSAGQPITFENGNNIYGTVCATGQTVSKNPNQSNQNISGGSTGIGLKPSCVAPPVPATTYDRNAHIAAMTITSANNNNSYLCITWNGVGWKRTWPANVKFTGNISADSCEEILITGNVYITGDFFLGGGTKIRIADSVGATPPVIIVDGNVRMNSPGGGGSIVPNASGTGARVISFKSSAACSPNCATVTGNDLKNSQSLETVTIAGGNANGYPGSIFQSYWGKIKVTAGGNIGSAIGQTVDMNGGGTVTYGTILSSGSRSWTVTSYQQDFN